MCIKIHCCSEYLYYLRAINISLFLHCMGYSNMGLATIKTDITGFDHLLGGGIPKGSTLLISGPPGAGKTVMALQYTFNQARKGERVLFVSTCELLYTINKFASSMSFFDLGLIRTGVNLDFYGPKEEGGFVEFWDYSLGPILEEQYVGDIFDVIQDKVSSHRIDHLVIDSLRLSTYSWATRWSGVKSYCYSWAGPPALAVRPFLPASRRHQKAPSASLPMASWT